MSGALLHEVASARHLGALRLWVFGMWTLDVAKDPLTDLAAIPIDYFEPVGVLRVLPASLWTILHTPEALGLWWASLIALTALAAAGVRPYRLVAGAACLLLTLYQGVIYSFAGPTHAELAALYAAYALAIFPSADGLSIRHGLGSRAPAPVYRWAFLTVTVMLLSTYMLVGVRRLFLGGVAIFTDGTILRAVVDRSASPDHLNASFGLQVLASAPLTGLVEAGFVVVTVFEVTSLFCLVRPWFRRAWLAVILLFHALSWPLMQTLFLHNILLIGALLVDWDGLARWTRGRRARPSPEGTV